MTQAFPVVRKDDNSDIATRVHNEEGFGSYLVHLAVIYNFKKLRKLNVIRFT